MRLVSTAVIEGRRVGADNCGFVDCHPASLAEVRLSSTLLRKRTHAGMSGRKSTSTDLVRPKMFLHLF